MKKVALVSCVSVKREGRHPAKDLYTSALFRYSRAYAESNADSWFILSARYGLIRPEEEVDSYDETLKGAPTGHKRRWAAMVWRQLREEGVLDGSAEILWLAGADYSKELRALMPEVRSADPMSGMTIGRRLQWLKRQT